jgi:hypothetical protein
MLTCCVSTKTPTRLYVTVIAGDVRAGEDVTTDVGDPSDWA